MKKEEIYDVWFKGSEPPKEYKNYKLLELTQPFTITRKKYSRVNCLTTVKEIQEFIELNKIKQ